MKRILFIIGFALIGLFYGCDDEMAQWRGKDRNGIFDESALLDLWPEEGPELVWVFEGLGRGFAAPSVTKDKIFVNGEENGKTYLFALDREGKLLWKSPNGDEFLGEGFSSTYPGARSTPTYYDKRVYATSGTGRLGCFDAKSGDELWSVDLMKDLDGLLGYFGFSESPLVDEEHVYCFPGGAKNNLLAFDRLTGEIAWSSEVMKDTVAYGSLIKVDLPERSVLIGSSRHNIYAVDHTSGQLLSSYRIEGYEYDGEHCNSPIYENGNIYFVANDLPGQGAFKVKLSDDATVMDEQWRNPAVLNNFGGFIVIDDHLFTCVKGNTLLSLDTQSGEIVDSLKVATGSISYADEKFFCYGMSGTINLVSYKDRELDVCGKVQVKKGSGQHFSHPVLANGIMYIRRGNALLAYQVSE